MICRLSRPLALKERADGQKGEVLCSSRNQWACVEETDGTNNIDEDELKLLPLQTWTLEELPLRYNERPQMTDQIRIPILG